MLESGSKGFTSGQAVRFVGPARRPNNGCRSYASGKCVYHQGDDAVYAYQVLSGVLRVSRVFESGRRQVLAFAFPGDTIGLPVGGFHTGTCDVLEDADLRPVRLTLGPSNSPGEVHDWLLEVSLNEVVRLSDLSFAIGALSTSQRLASFLGHLMTRLGRRAGREIVFHLPMAREDISDHLGMKIETVSRSFTDLRKRGLLALPEPSRVVVLDPVGLERMAGGAD